MFDRLRTASSPWLQGLLLAAIGATPALAMLPPAPTPAPTLAYDDVNPLLMRRADCPANMFQCPTSLGPAFSDVCCQNGQTCAVDNDNNPACCPSGVVCTGAAPSGNPTATASEAISYVSNSYFSFPYALTDIDDRAACQAAVDACSENYEICTANLGGGGDGNFQVTVEVPGGGGITVGGSGPDLGQAEATSVCSSLSSEACSALEATSCDSYDNGAVIVGAQAPTGMMFAVLSSAASVAALFLG